MPRGWAALFFLLLLQCAWGCPHLDCFTDYQQTVTCVVETRTLHPSTLTLTWQDQYGELEDEVTSCLLRPAGRNATHTEYTCHMNVSVFMPDDQFSVNATEVPGGPSQECGSFLLFQSIRPSRPGNVTVVPAELGEYLVTWSTAYDSLDSSPLKGKLQFQLQYWDQGDHRALRPHTKLVSVDAREVRLPASEFPGGSSFMLRLRARPNAGSLLGGPWSEWSPPATFRTPSAEPKGNWYLYLLLVILLPPALVFLALKVHLPWRLCKKVWVQVPSPEWFFQPLYTGHSGDFKKWVGTPFTASSLELGAWNSGLPATLEMDAPTQGTKVPPELSDPEPDGVPEQGPEAGSWACGLERPYGLVSIDTVTLDGGYPALNWDADTGAGLLPHLCILGGPSGPGGLLGGLEVPPAAEAGSPPGLDLDTFDSGFAGSGCSSPVDCGFPGASDEGPPRSYLRQWVVTDPPTPDPAPPASSQEGDPGRMGACDTGNPVSPALPPGSPSAGVRGGGSGPLLWGGRGLGVPGSPG